MQPVENLKEGNPLQKNKLFQLLLYDLRWKVNFVLGEIVKGSFTTILVSFCPENETDLTVMHVITMLIWSEDICMYLRRKLILCMPGSQAWCPAPERRPPAIKALHTTCSNNASVVSSSWWWTYKCPKHVEQITSATNHSVESNSDSPTLYAVSGFFALCFLR